jgi:hypothetical protein
MVDYPQDAPDETLLDSHLRRYGEWASLVGNQTDFPNYAQRQPGVDSTLTYMMHD